MPRPCVQCVATAEWSLLALLSASRSQRARRSSRSQSQAARRETLPQELETHVCSDRNQGKLTVPLNHSRTLTALAATTMPLAPLDQECRGAEGQEEAGEVQDPSAESDSCDDISADEECHVNRCVKQSKLPNALKERGDRIQKGMVVAVLCSAKEGEPMAG